MTHQKKLLLGRLLTRSGDHAWDFAVPLALLHAFPGRLQIAAVYYLITKLLMMLVTPKCGRWMDQTPRLKVLQAGILMQFIAVVAGGFFFWGVDTKAHEGNALLSSELLPFFAGLLVMGVFASLGALMMEISVGNDVVPSVVPAEGLTSFNSWLRRADLCSEVISPILAGLLFTYRPLNFHLAGFFLVVLWNVISFFPEYFLLRVVISKISDLKDRVPAAVSLPSFWSRLWQFDLKALQREPLAPLLISYSLLWLSALSPHGVLLTGYLKDQAKLPEFEIGVFRGLGALFGLLSTVSFPFLVGKTDLLKSSKLHLAWQALVLVFGAMVFFAQESFSIYWFLAFVLLSRIGLYGFMNGEFELRQRLIPADSRGRVNSYSSVLTTMATLFLFGLGSLLPNTEDFRILVLVSVVMVVAAFVLFHFWSTRFAKLRSKELL
jgi:iron-regulated transporter 1